MLSNGAMGGRNDKAAKRGEYTLNPSDIDFVDHAKEFVGYPKMLYKGIGVAEEDQIVVVDEADHAAKRALGWQTVEERRKMAEPLTAPIEESAVAPLKKRGRPAKSDAVLA